MDKSGLTGECAHVFCHRYVIFNQLFSVNVMTCYGILDRSTGRLFYKTAEELYNSDDLPFFSAADIRNIAYTALMETDLTSSG